MLSCLLAAAVLLLVVSAGGTGGLDSFIDDQAALDVLAAHGISDTDAFAAADLSDAKLKGLGLPMKLRKKIAKAWKDASMDSSTVGAPAAPAEAAPAPAGRSRKPLLPLPSATSVAFPRWQACQQEGGSEGGITATLLQCLDQERGEEPRTKERRARRGYGRRMMAVSAARTLSARERR